MRASSLTHPASVVLQQAAALLPGLPCVVGGIRPVVLTKSPPKSAAGALVPASAHQRI